MNFPDQTGYWTLPYACGKDHRWLLSLGCLVEIVDPEVMEISVCAGGPVHHLMRRPGNLYVSTFTTEQEMLLKLKYGDELKDVNF